MVDELRCSLCACRAAIATHVSKHSAMISDIASVVADYVVDHLVIDDIVNNSRTNTNEFDESWILYRNIHDDLILIIERRPYHLRTSTHYCIHETVMIDKHRLLQLLLGSKWFHLDVALGDATASHLRVDQWVVDDMMHQLSLSARRITAAFEKIDHSKAPPASPASPASQSRTGNCIIL